jgi:hypothetical protein
MKPARSGPVFLRCPTFPPGNKGIGHALSQGRHRSEAEVPEESQCPSGWPKARGDATKYKYKTHSCPKIIFFIFSKLAFKRQVPFTRSHLGGQDDPANEPGTTIPATAKQTIPAGVGLLHTAKRQHTMADDGPYRNAEETRSPKRGIRRTSMRRASGPPPATDRRSSH